jgi:3-oxoacyl-[acyl-carrier protein] reductase
MDFGLKGKVAMVAGASRGLGFAVAEALAAEGAYLSISSRHQDAIEKAAERIASHNGSNVLATTADVSVAADIERWCHRTAERWGGVDVLVTNSGGPPPGDFVSLDDAVWQKSFDLLVISAVRLARTALPSMKGRPGASILFLTSSSVKEPIAHLTLSTVLRASVAALAKTLALELAPEGIRVNQLVPGRISTERLRELDENRARRAGISLEQQQAQGRTEIPLSRYGEPREFGKAAAFLASEAASYVTGATLQVDGGLIRSVM